MGKIKSLKMTIPNSLDAMGENIPAIISLVCHFFVIVELPWRSYGEMLFVIAFVPHAHIYAIVTKCLERHRTETSMTTPIPHKTQVR